MGNTPVEVQFTSAGCLNYPCRTPRSDARSPRDPSKLVYFVGTAAIVQLNGNGDMQGFDFGSTVGPVQPFNSGAVGLEGLGSAFAFVSGLFNNGIKHGVGPFKAKIPTKVIISRAPSSGSCYCAPVICFSVPPMARRYAEAPHNRHS